MEEPECQNTTNGEGVAQLLLIGQQHDWLGKGS